MKRAVIFFNTLLFTLGFAVITQASPIYYTFSGTVTTITDPTGIISASGLIVGSEVQYTFLIDFGADGKQTKYNGTVETRTNYGDTDFFYTDYLYGSALQPKDGGYWSKQPGGNAVAEYNYGFDEPDTL